MRMGQQHSIPTHDRTWQHSGLSAAQRVDEIVLHDDMAEHDGVLERMGDPELASIVAFTSAEYKASVAGLSVLLGRREIVLGAVGTDITEVSLADSFGAVVLQQPDAPLVVPDARADARFAHFQTVTGLPFIRFCAGVAVLDRAGRPLAALCIGDRRPLTERFDPTILLIRAREVERLIW